MRPQRIPYGLLKLARLRGWRQAFASLTFVLFALQSYLTQTHIHLLLQGVPATSVEAFAGVQPLKAGDAPLPADNPATCPICLDMVLAGYFTSPAAIVLPLPVEVAAFAPTAATTPVHVTAVTHIWRGRAPPKH